MTLGWVICGASVAMGDASKRFMPLIELSAQRLAIAHKVALSKWDSGAAVNDAHREEQVLEIVVQDGEKSGLDSVQVQEFFRAQFEASKLVQYSLLAEWQRQNGAPTHDAVNLAKDVRPQLDEIDKRLIGALKSTVEVRSSKTCPRNLANAVGKYLEAHRLSAESREGIALDRGMASACIR